MTTSVSPSAVPARRPFASLDSPRLQRLANSKNRQNAIQHSTAMKRPYSPPTSSFEENDTENIDPAVFGSPTKRSKTMEGCQLTTTATPSEPNASQFVLTESGSGYEASTDSVMTAMAVTFARPIAPATRVNTKRTIQHHASQQKSPKLIATAAGRSPKSKRFGILNRRRTSSPFMRIDPPASHTGSPISIDAALSGTIPSYAARAQATYTPQSALVDLDDTVKTSKHWFFQIYEDTEQDTLTNLMEHSTCTLDISDDEGRRAERDARGKENIPPTPDNLMGNGVETPSAPPSFPVTQMDIERAPLGNLKPSDFYSEDASDLDSPAAADNSLSAPELPSIMCAIDASTPKPQAESLVSAPVPQEPSLDTAAVHTTEVSVYAESDEPISAIEHKSGHEQDTALVEVTTQAASRESDALIL